MLVNRNVTMEKPWRPQGSVDPAGWLAREDERRQARGNWCREDGAISRGIILKTPNFGGVLDSAKNRLRQNYLALFGDLCSAHNV
jgi:hypothetical protein